jgi:hypothetical protein
MEQVTQVVQAVETAHLIPQRLTPEQQVKVMLVELQVFLIPVEVEVEVEPLP